MDGFNAVPIEQVKAACHNAVDTGVAEMGGMIVDDAHAQLSVAYPPASAPGDKPHRRTGNLAGGVTPHHERTDRGFTMTIAFERPGGDPRVPNFLEVGTEKMKARPFAGPLRDQWAQDGPAILPGLISSRFVL